MIRAMELTKHYGSTVAVDHLSFDVKPGIVTGFLGPNGSGKSTTMRMILGLDRPTEGSSTVGGKSYRNLAAPMHEVGALLDAKAIQGNRSARQHLKWMAQAGGIPVRRVDEVLEIVGLTDVAGRKTGGFSLGMSQRLGIASALLGDPEVLLFDEPVNGLDPEGIIWVRTLLRRLASEGRTVFVSSHLMSEMQETADHVLVIGRGRLIADMSVDEFIQRSSGSTVRVSSPQASELATKLTEEGATVSRETNGTVVVSGMDAPRIGEIASENAVVLHELTPIRASLEDAFIEMTRGSVDYQGSDDQGPLAAETMRAPQDGEATRDN